MGNMTAQANIVVLVLAALAIYVKADMMDKFKSRMNEAEVGKCLASTGFQPQGPPPSSPDDFTPEHLCFLKCVMEEKGLIKNGQVDQSALEDKSLPVPEDKRDEMKKCAAAAGTIESCQDMKKLLACVPS